MSRFYEMRLEISGFDPLKRYSIEIAAEKEWDEFSKNWSHREGVLRTSGHSYLTGRMTEEEFVDQLTVAIWKANGKYCKVEIVAVCLEDLPSEYHKRDEKDYERLKDHMEEEND